MDNQSMLDRAQILIKGVTNLPTIPAISTRVASLLDDPDVELEEVADLILKGLTGAITSKRVTYDFARLMTGATEIKCSQFGDNIIEHM